MLGYQTHKVEQQVAAISGSYTNALQLKARYDVLKERQQLKYAALDCWKIVAEQLPAGISLQRFSFADGQKLSLSGTAAPDQINSSVRFLRRDAQGAARTASRCSIRRRRAAGLPPERQHR